MATPADLSPKQYEVLKLRNGLEVVGMTRDTAQGIEITLPMVCRLSSGPTPVEKLSTFFPYAPLTSDTKVTVPIDHILHRNIMNEQYIPFYDEASSQWLDMLENNSIPLINGTAKRKYIDKVLQNLIDEVSGRDEMYDYEDFDLEFEESLPPTDKKKLH